MKNLITYLFIGSLIPLSFIACKKSESGSTNSRLSFYLTDDPAPYDTVNIDIQDIQVNTSDTTSANGWTSLPLTRKGIYNLLDFRNGLDTLLASQELPSGKLSQIRLVLGANNSVVLKGIRYPLITPSSQQSGLKLNLHATLLAGIEYRVWIDFDAARSIIKNGNNSHILKPVIRTYSKATTGAVKGTVQPGNTGSFVYAVTNTSDTIGSALADSLTGIFFIGGLDSGAFALKVNGGSGYKDTTLNNVSVTTGAVTDVGIINLHQ